jgi:hypothetical protein
VTGHIGKGVLEPPISHRVLLLLYQIHVTSSAQVLQVYGLVVALACFFFQALSAFWPQRVLDSSFNLLSELVKLVG